MKVTHFECGPAANESERKAFAHLKSRLISVPGEGEWILLTNLAFSATDQRQSDEIDLVAIGPSGVRVIEVKHWSEQWVDSNKDVVEQAADLVTNKAKKVATTLRKIVPSLGRVDGVFLLTRDPLRVKSLAGKKIRGVQYHVLSGWRDAIGIDSPSALTPAQVQMLARTLKPSSAVAVDGSLRRLAAYLNLELQTPKDERFHRIYRGVHSTSQDRIILHLYDLSASDEPNSETKARREFEALLRLQLYPWAPRIRDSFQDAPGYPGEMYFFTIVDPSAPCIDERTSDTSWDTKARLAFARSTVRALDELHQAETDDNRLVHRNLTPETILVRHDNSPILTGFERTKISADISVASAGVSKGKGTFTVSPEVHSQGLGAADQRSDVYSLCACLTRLFLGREDETSQWAMQLLDEGLAKKPEKRATLQDLDLFLSERLGESVPAPAVPPARFWTEDQEVSSGNHTYRIVSRLGSGGVGTTFKVVQIDRTTKEDLGTYVAKVGHDKEKGQRVLKSYNLARPYLGQQATLSAIFEVARDWQENDFIALMTWIEGEPLAHYIGEFSRLTFEGTSSEGVALRWLRTMCEALAVLHDNGLVHGDVSPRNIIVSGRDLVLIDYDFVTKIGDRITAPGTILYCPPFQQEKQTASPEDDIYSLAASFFHVVFEKVPFQHNGTQAKERGLNWESVDREEYANLAEFLDKATHPDREQRFKSVELALVALKTALLEEIPPAPQRRRNQVAWLQSLLQSYPGSRWGNRETRGLDTEFTSQTYVETKIEEALIRDIQTRSVRLVILCGNAGDGKTALLQHLAARLGLGQQPSSRRILAGRMEDGLIVRMNLDGSAAWKDRSADELLDEFLKPFLDGPPVEDVVHLLAINDGRLLEWIEKDKESLLTKELYAYLSGEQDARETYIRFIDLNQRSLVGGIALERREIETDFLERLLDQLYGGDNATEIWSPCLTCSAQERCEVFRATKVFGPKGLGFGEPTVVRSHARKRLFEALQAVHLRGETHITVRELRAALVYILFGTHYCRDFHEGRGSPPYWERAFSPESAGRQGEVLRELVRLDPALEAHPQIDRQLLRANAGNDLESARRRAYFEWMEDALDLAQGRHLRRFRSLPICVDKEKQTDLCARLCRGISCLEDLPNQAFERSGVVPLRITPRTPTETTFWVEKPVSAFRLEAGVSQETKDMEKLHRDAFLIYRRLNGGEEQLRMGVDLFHLLLELSDGYQMGDVSSDDTFAHLSIFVQRLVQEDDREIFAWNPMEDETVYKISADKQMTEGGLQQKLVARQISTGGPA